MADTGDQAQALSDLALRMAFEAHEIGPVLRLLPDGACHWCGEDVKPEALFCNGKCADAHAADFKKRIK